MCIFADSGVRAALRRAPAWMIALVSLGAIAPRAHAVADTLGVAEREDHSPYLVAGPNGPAALWIATAPDTGSAGRFDEIAFSQRLSSGWTAPEIVASGGDYYTPQVAFAPSDERWICWAEHDGTDSQIRVRWNDAVTSQTFTLGDPAQPDLAPMMCVARNDSVVVVWQGWREDDYEILLSTGNSTGFSAPVVISASALNDRDPQIVWGADRAWIVWSSYENQPYNLSCRTFDGGALTPEVSLTDSYRARNLHPTIAWDDAAGVLWVAWIKVNQGWAGFNQHEFPALYDRGSPRILAYDGTSLFHPAGLDADERYPLLDMEQLGYERYVYSGPIPAYDRFGTGLQLAIDAGHRVWIFQKQVGSLTEGSVPNRYFGAIGTNFRGATWAAPNEFAELRTSIGWEAPRAVAVGDTLWVAWTADDRTPVLDTVLNCFGHDLNLVIRAVPLDNSSSPAPTLVPIGSPGTPPTLSPTPREDFTVQDGNRTLHLLWGDNHRHSHDLSWDGTSDPPYLDNVMYGQDWLKYDFLAPSDHAEKFGKAEWAWVAKWATILDVPDHFRLFPAYERSMRGGAGGDQNCLYRSVDEFEESTAGYPAISSWHTMYAAQAGRDVIAVPHTMAQCGGDATIDWYHLADGDPSVLPAPLRLMEVYQAARESFEYPGCPRQFTGCVTAPDTGWVSVPLALGMRVGLLAASDHDIKAAYVGVLAEDRSRDAIFEGLYARRTSGTTRTKRASLEFRVAGVLQGGETVSATSPTIFVSMHADEPVSVIEINKNGNPSWFSVACTSADTTFQFVDPDPVVPGTSSFYYLRVRDSIDRMFWASPVWVDFVQPTDVPTVAATVPVDWTLSVSPNPARDATSIRLVGLPTDTPATVRIHDVSGRLVRSLAPAAGSGPVTWDGRDASGHETAAGVYWVVAQSGGRMQHKRLVRLR
ncbi:MAG: hypothetical protein KC591_13345 [Gemmatimonadetes bacterium]|nr:hypothetical protein [Gemmatimonadota bacterium]